MTCWSYSLHYRNVSIGWNVYYEESSTKVRLKNNIKNLPFYHSSWPCPFSSLSSSACLRRLLGLQHTEHCHFYINQIHKGSMLMAVELTAKNINIYPSNGAVLHGRVSHTSCIWPAIKHSKVCFSAHVPLPSSGRWINEKRGVINSMKPLWVMPSLHFISVLSLRCVTL